MHRRIRPRLTYANVASSLALFIAMSGGAVYAADRIGGDEIESNAIRDRHVAKNSIGASELENNANGTFARIRTTTQGIDPGARDTVIARCQPGEIAVGGGYGGDADPGQEPVVRNNAPLGSQTSVVAEGWYAVLTNPSERKVNYQVHAMCAPLFP
jgi:hypothetical protein